MCEYVYVYVCCKVLTLHGLLTRHVAHAHARYRCRTAVHTASTLEVQHRTLSSWSLGYPQTQTLQLVLGASQKLLNLIHTITL